MKTEIKKKAVRRLKIIEGQIRGIERMIDKDEYCIGIIGQLLAAKHALSGIEDLILENHLATCAVSRIKSGKGMSAIKEIVAVYKLSKKK